MARSNLTRLSLIVVVAGVALAAGALWLGGPSSAPGGGQGQGNSRKVGVVVATVAPAPFADTIEAVGTANANESVELTAKVTETVGALNFADGQKVEAGYAVAELTSSEQSADLAAARAELAEARQQYDRAQDLFSRGSGTRAQLQAATAARDSAAARVNALESRLSDRLIKAPFGGVLGLRRVSVGTLVRPGDVITTLDDISVIKLDFTVPETFVATIAAGQTVRAQAAAFPGRVFEGQVQAVDSRVDPVTRAVTVRAELPNPDSALKPGMLMTVSLIKNARTALAVPETSLVPMDGKQYVFVVKDDLTADRREVKIGAREPGVVEILGGLQSGERVVSEGTMRVVPGGPVEILTGAPSPGEANASDEKGPRS